MSGYSLLATAISRKDELERLQSKINRVLALIDEWRNERGRVGNAYADEVQAILENKNK